MGMSKGGGAVSEGSSARTKADEEGRVSCLKGPPHLPRGLPRGNPTPVLPVPVLVCPYVNGKLERWISS